MKWRVLRPVLSYNNRMKKIGIRIKEEREKMGLKPKEFLPQIYKSEKSHKMLTAWENGERIPDLDSLALMSELFNCDIGYLLCDYDERTRDVADVATVTGLTGDAISILIGLSGDDMEILNEILVSPHLMGLISAISEGVESPRIKSNLVIEFMKERLSGNEKKGLTDSVRKYVAEDIGTIYKFKATDAAGKMYDEVSDTLCDRRAEHG